MKLYRVPFKIHQAKARTKAAVAYYQRLIGDNAYEVLPEPGAKAVEFWASSNATAMCILQELVLPGDPREVKGRSMVRYFIVAQKPEPSQ
jgi:hypothetical protein